MSENDAHGRTPPPSEPGKVSSGDEAARAVRDVLEDQAQRRVRQDEATRKKRKKRLLPLPVVALLWGVACLVVWVATPEFLLPEPVPEPTPAELEAGLRMEMLVLVGEVNEFRQETGRVPDTLDRVADDPPRDVRYTSLPPDSYRLTGTRGGVEVVYQSGRPLEELRANARAVIRGSAGGDG